MPDPVAVTSISLCRPSLAASIRQRTSLLPRCCATSHHAGLPVVFHRQRVLDIGKLAVRKFHIHNGTHNLYNSSFIHKLSHFLLFFCALAPAQTSVISCVIAACLALLYCIDSSFVSSVALSVADFMAIIRALCSLAKASTRAP